MFAEDVGLLRDNLFTQMLEASRDAPAEFADNASRLFGAMATGGKLSVAPAMPFEPHVSDRPRLC